MQDKQFIPKMIHQSWKTHTLPPALAHLPATWKRHHPDWEYRFWTDEDNRELLSQHYSWFLPIYDAYDQPIKKANAARYFIVYHYGGLYVDIDFECLRPLDELLDGKRLALSWEPPLEDNRFLREKRGIERAISDAFIASEPFHPFWEHIFQRLVENRDEEFVLDAVSVIMLTRAYGLYKDKDQLTLLPSELLFPLKSWETRGVEFDTQKIHQRVGPQAFAIHYWYGSWWADEVITLARKRIRRRNQQREDRK